MNFDQASVEQEIIKNVRLIAEFVRADFQRVIGELQADSISGTFEGYVAVIEEFPTTYTLPQSGLVLNVIRAEIFVRSPYTDLNVFDIVDTGRKALPARTGSKGGYPLWSARSTSLTSTSSRRNIRTGRFSLAQQTGAFAGVRPESSRFKLRGAYPKGATLRPVFWTRKALPAVPARNLYDRILRQSLKKMRAKQYTGYELVKAVRRSG